MDVEVAACLRRVARRHGSIVSLVGAETEGQGDERPWREKSMMFTTRKELDNKQKDNEWCLFQVNRNELVKGC